jgi:hypothetical protein
MPNADGYNWEVVPEGNAQGVGVVASDYTTHSEASVTGLTQNTGYDLRAQSICPDRAVSAWSDPFTFTTPCDAYIAPFTEDFENGGATPVCWTNSSSSGELWVFSTAGIGHSITFDHTTGTGYFASIDDSEPPHSTDVTLTTPYIDVSGLTVPYLDFWYHSDDEGTTYGNMTLHVNVWDGAAWNNDFATYCGNTAGWENKIVDLSTLTITGPIQIQFVGDETSSGTGWYDDISLDDITVDEAPTCPNPTAQTVSIITTSGADLGWTSVDSFFDIYIVPFGDPAPTPTTTPTVDDNPGTSYTWTGGTADTAYDWYVRADCAAGGGTGQSDWVGPNTFSTLFDGIQIGNGTNTNQHLPIEPFYGYTYSQSIYLASEFGTPGADKRIERILYNYSWTGGDDDCDTWVVYMGTTANTALTDWLPVSGLTPVYSGDVNLEFVSGTGWLEIILDTPFEYDPATDGNLVIGVDENMPSYTTSSDEFFCDLDARADVSYYYYNDSTNPDPASPPAGTASAYYPNTRFIIGDIPTVPVFSINPDTKDFGTLYVGYSSSPQTFTISNVGVDTLVISSVSITGADASQFILTDLNTYPDSLTTNTISVDVTFHPTSAGVKSANLTVIDNLTRVTHDIPLTGTGFVPPQGSICSDPLPLTLPAVDVSGDTDGFFDDYNSTDINPSSYYLNGDDVVYQFTTTEDYILSGTIVTPTGSWMGTYILSDCPKIISSWPSPQSIDYNINLSVAPLGVPANVLISVDAAGLTTVTWDAVTGADSYIVYGCDTPDGTFTDISADGSFTGESWTSTAALGDKKFIQISAVRTPTRDSIIREPLTSEERRKVESNNDKSNK